MLWYWWRFQDCLEYLPDKALAEVVFMWRSACTVLTAAEESECGTSLLKADVRCFDWTVATAEIMAFGDHKYYNIDNIHAFNADDKRWMTQHPTNICGD